MDTALITFNVYKTTSEASTTLVIVDSPHEEALLQAGQALNESEHTLQHLHGIFESPSFSRYHLSVHWLFTV